MKTAFMYDKIKENQPLLECILLNKNNYKKVFKRIIAALLILVIATAIGVFTTNAYVKKIASETIVSASSIPPAQYDCIIVLGCGIHSDGSPSPMLADRLTRAIELYNMEVAPKIIMSGDHGRTNYNEVNVMREYALERGVAKEDIFMDNAGFSTYESMYRAKEIFCAENAIIVTQEYHLYRAVYIANELGINAIGINADYSEYAGQNFRDVRELAARSKDFLTCIFKPEPTYLGDSIPVSGDGTVTCD